MEHNFKFLIVVFPFTFRLYSSSSSSSFQHFETLTSFSTSISDLTYSPSSASLFCRLSIQSRNWLIKETSTKSQRFRVSTSAPPWYVPISSSLSYLLRFFPLYSLLCISENEAENMLHSPGGFRSLGGSFVTTKKTNLRRKNVGTWTDSNPFLRPDLCNLRFFKLTVGFGGLFYFLVK